MMWIELASASCGMSHQVAVLKRCDVNNDDDFVLNKWKSRSLLLFLCKFCEANDIKPQRLKRL